MEQPNKVLVNDEALNIIESLLKKMIIKNYTIDISPGSVHGDNYMGIIAKVVIIGEDKYGKNKKINFIVKSAPQNKGLRGVSPIRSIFDREIYMYSKVFPTFIKFQEEKGISKPFNPFAKYYGSTMTEYNESLIMENMKELGFSLCNRSQPLDYNHVMLVMREYGKLHALSLALRAEQPEFFNKELPDILKDEYFKNLILSEFNKKASMEPFKRALLSLDPIADKEAYNKFKHFPDRMFDLLVEATATESAGQYAVITHGDCWINNILYKYEDPLNPKLPSELCLLDWQLTRISSPVLDLAYFIFTCTDKTLRDQHYDDIIHEYYNSLKSFLIELGSDPERMFPFDVLQAHLKKFSVFGLYTAVLVLHLMTSENDEIPDFYNVDDIEKMAESLSFTSRNEDIYNNKIRAVILDFVKFGYEF